MYEELDFNGVIHELKCLHALKEGEGMLNILKMPAIMQGNVKFFDDGMGNVSLVINLLLKGRSVFLIPLSLHSTS